MGPRSKKKSFQLRPQLRESDTFSAYLKHKWMELVQVESISKTGLPRLVYVNTEKKVVSELIVHTVQCETIDRTCVQIIAVVQHL